MINTYQNKTKSPESLRAFLVIKILRFHLLLSFHSNQPKGGGGGGGGRSFGSSPRVEADGGGGGGGGPSGSVPQIICFSEFFKIQIADWCLVIEKIEKQIHPPKNKEINAFFIRILFKIITQK